MKNVPNIITAFRILISVILLFLKPFGFWFWIMYSACGLSDILDGYIARKTGSASKLGAILDSIADIAFICAAVVVILPRISVSIGIWIWIILIFAVRIVSLFVAYLKYRAFAPLHTYLNKATGLILFCSPFLYGFINVNVLGCIMCAVASVSSIEELMIHITLRELSRDIKGILAKKQ